MKAHRSVHGRGQGAEAHPDGKWIRSHFGWAPPSIRRVSQLPDGSAELFEKIEPPQLWGTHAPLQSAWERDLGLNGMQSLTLAPEVVALAGSEPSTLRAAAGSVLG